MQTLTAILINTMDNRKRETAMFLQPEGFCVLETLREVVFESLKLLKLRREIQL